MKTLNTAIGGQIQKSFLTNFDISSSITRWLFQGVSLLGDVVMGILLGGLAGWAIGWRLGAFYAANAEPFHLMTVEDVDYWCRMPAAFAAHGLWIGAVIGITAVRLYSLKLLKAQIISLYEQGQKKPCQLARILDRNPRKIKSILHQLFQRGRLTKSETTTGTDSSYKDSNKEIKMRKLNAFCVALLSVFIFFGCLPSLHPLYTEDTLVFDEQLVGKWYGEGEIWSFVHAGGKKYGLSVLDDDGKQAAFEVHLVQLGEHRFIDLYPGKNMDLENTAGMYSFNLMPAHTFMKIELSDPNLKLQWVYLGELIEDDPNLLKHELIPENSKGNDTFQDDTILITAQSEDIQRVILQNMEKVFTEHAGGEFRRCPSVFSENDIIFEQRLMGQWQSKKNQYWDIIEWETGAYDIMISDEPDKCREFKAVLYLLDNWRLLGLYSNPPSKAEEEAGLHLIPDAFLLVEQIEPELILHRIDWETMHEFLHGDYALGGGSLPEPDYVLQKSGL